LCIDVVLEFLTSDPAAVGERIEVEQRQRATRLRNPGDALRVPSVRPERADQRAHAGANHEVVFDPRVLQYAHRADVGVAARPATAQYQCDFRTGFQRFDTRLRDGAVAVHVIEWGTADEGCKQACAEGAPEAPPCFVRFVILSAHRVPLSPSMPRGQTRLQHWSCA
jgi:hypothetical protein